MTVGRLRAMYISRTEMGNFEPLSANSEPNLSRAQAAAAATEIHAAPANRAPFPVRESAYLVAHNPHI